MGVTCGLTRMPDNPEIWKAAAMADQFDKMQKLPDPLPGCPNFHRIPGYKVYTCGQPTPSSPATPRSPPPPLSPPLALPPPQSPLSEVPTPVLDVTSPTPLEPSMLPRGRPRLTPTTTVDTTDVDTDSATGATDTVSDTA